jgi:hypothetical protein
MTSKKQKSLTSKEKLLKSAYLRIIKGTDFVDALYDSASKQGIGDNVLADCFESLSLAVKRLTDKRQRMSLCEYMDSEEHSIKDLFENVRKNS